MRALSKCMHACMHACMHLLVMLGYCMHACMHALGVYLGEIVCCAVHKKSGGCPGYLPVYIHPKNGSSVSQERL